MKYRILGRTGERVSLVGLGGFHLAKPGGASARRRRSASSAPRIDAGINFCDNCWDYNGGESEVRLGRALRDGYRERAFLMTKIDGRTAEAAMAQLETSLQRLQTDHLDLLQFHEIIRMDDPERVFAAGGALEAVLRAREQGKLRYIGFTGHKSPAIHTHMFEVADRHDFHFDTVQMPLNVMDAHFDSFEQGVLPVARRHGTAVLAMKTFGDPFILEARRRRADRDAALLDEPAGRGGDHRLRQHAHPAAGAAGGAQLRADDRRSSRPRCWRARPRLREDGKTERYKMSQHFDGTVQNPQWLTEA